MCNVAIITAAGKGLRMKSLIKKQYIKLEGKPILCYTLDAFILSNLYDHIFVTCPEKDIEYLENLLFNQFDYNQNEIILIVGGVTRRDSVYNALLECPTSTNIVAIHDSVRPFIKLSEIHECHVTTRKYGAATLGHPVKNTIKKVKDDIILSTVARKDLWEVYTPQTFDYKLIKKAHDYAKKNNIPANDDAELVELIGHEVRIILGSPLNIKITDKFDLHLAKKIIKEFNEENTL